MKRRIIQGKAGMSPCGCWEYIAQAGDGERNAIARDLVRVLWIVARWQSGQEGGHGKPMHEGGLAGDRVQISLEKVKGL